MSNIFELTKSYTAWCDKCDYWEESREPTIKDASKYFEEIGWKKVCGEVLCPNCASGRKGSYNIFSQIEG